MKIFTPSLLIVSCFVIGGIIFKVLSPTKCPTILPNDNIFVLTGDVRRIPFAMAKLHKYPDANLYIIGAGAKGLFNVTRHVKTESDSKSTYQNALAIKKIVQENNIDRLVLITTEDHMNRAKYLVRRELPDTEIVSCPIKLKTMPAAKRLERWTIEYVKYIFTVLGIKES